MCLHVCHKIAVITTLTIKHGVIGIRTPPLSVQLFVFSCSFWEQIGQIYNRLVPQLSVLAPLGNPGFATDILHLLPPATKLGQGYIFTGVCHSVNGGLGPGGCGIPACTEAPQADTPWADTPKADTPWQDTPPLGIHPPGRHPLGLSTSLGLSTPRTKYTPSGTKYTQLRD